MMQHETFVTSVELKFLGDDQPGVFDGYGAIFNRVDAHGDIILPGAFTATLDDYKSRGTMPGLYAEHSIYMGGDPLPAGTWMELAQDDTGLRGKGKISALDTDYGRRVRGLMVDGALRGLSIAFQVPQDGATYTNAKKPGDPRRIIKALDLVSLDIVRDPSQSAARVDQVRSLMGMVDKEQATKSVAAAISLHSDCMSGGDSPTAAERAMMLSHLQSAHKALTGYEMPTGAKSVRGFEVWLREELHLSHALARAVTDGLKSLPRDEGRENANAGAAALSEVLAGFLSRK